MGSGVVSSPAKLRTIRHSCTSAPDADSVTACLFCVSLPLQPNPTRTWSSPLPRATPIRKQPFCRPPASRASRPLPRSPPSQARSPVRLFSTGLGMKSPAPSTHSHAGAGTMAPPSTLDLFILTFNCAKNLIDPSIFASHLSGALSQNATGLPDLVVFSLQEVAPLSYAFIGSYFLNPYYARYSEALNIASAQVFAASSEGSDDGDAPAASSTPLTGGGASTQQKHAPQYTLVRAKNIGMTSILLYARDPAAIRKVEEAECGFGAADMGNKGAVGLRVTWGDDTTNKTTELTFVAAHLAAMEWNLKKRNANWRSIVSGLTFANPRSALPGVFPDDRSNIPTPDRSGAGDNHPPAAPSRLPTGDSPDPSEEEEPSDADGDETHPLLTTSTSETPTSPATTTTTPTPLSPSQRTALQALSLYSPTSHLFVAGDLNYRIDSTTPPAGAAFPSFDPASEHYFPSFFARDQLTRERNAGRTLHGLSEAAVGFGPTYKFDVLPVQGQGVVGEGEEGGREPGNTVPWRFAPHRWPSWCDRVLYLDVPRHVAAAAAAAAGGSGGGEGEQAKAGMVDVRAYDALPVVATSDHRAVFFRARVPVLSAEEMTLPPPAGDEEEEADAVLVEQDVEREEERLVPDPRVQLPVPVDVHAWERRAAARRKELLVGWSALVWSTREGAVLLATALALSGGAWWLWRVW